MRLRKSDKELAERLDHALDAWQHDRGPLPGIVDGDTRACFRAQLIASDRTRRFIEHYRESTRLTENQRNPNCRSFDPYAAAVLHHRKGNRDEALWLVFLAVHFGRHPKSKWDYCRLVYGKQGNGCWDWPSVASDVEAFRKWLRTNYLQIKADVPSGGFGNHRKRESLSDDGTGAVVASYVSWIGASGRHTDAFDQIVSAAPTVNEQFDLLYDSMSAVYRFGRLGRFDYLTTAARLGLVEATAGRPYLPGSTGPLKGARCLFGKMTPLAIEDLAVDFCQAIGVSPAVLEDALCNWQKSPNRFVRFRG